MNLFSRPNRKTENEITEILFQSDSTRIEKIISDHHTTNWYDQDEDEFVSLLSGEAIIEFADKSQIILNKGDNLLIKKHQKHRVIKTTKCIWLCVFSK